MLNSKVKTLGGFAVEVARGSCVATLMLCAGCIAFSVFGDHRCEVRNPKPDVRRTRLDPAGVDTPLPCSEFLDRWGLPDETQTTAGGDKLLTYKAGLRWNGFFFVFVVVPFGIGIPAGHATITLVVHDEKVIQARTLNGGEERAGFYFGPPVGSCSHAYSPEMFSRDEEDSELAPMFRGDR